MGFFSSINEQEAIDKINKFNKIERKSDKTQDKLDKSMSKLNSISGARQILQNSATNLINSSGMFSEKLKQLTSELGIIKNNSKFLFGFKDSKGFWVSFGDAINGFSEQEASNSEEVEKLKNDLKAYIDLYKFNVEKIKDFSKFQKENLQNYSCYATETFEGKNNGDFITRYKNNVDEKNNEIDNIINNLRKVCDKRCFDVLNTFFRCSYVDFASKTLNYLNKIGNYDAKNQDIEILKSSIQKFNIFAREIRENRIDQNLILFEFNTIFEEFLRDDKFFKVFVSENSICFQDPSRQRKITDLNSDYWRNLAKKATPQKQSNYNNNGQSASFNNNDSKPDISNNSNYNSNCGQSKQSGQSGNSKIPNSQFQAGQSGQAGSSGSNQHNSYYSDESVTSKNASPQFKPTGGGAPTQQSKSGPANDNSKKLTPQEEETERKIQELRIQYLNKWNILLKRYIPKATNVIKEINEQSLIHEFLKNLVKKNDSDLISELDKSVNDRKEIVEDFNKNKDTNTGEKNIESLDKLIASGFCVLKKVLEILNSNLTMIEKKLYSDSRYNNQSKENYIFFKENKVRLDNSLENEAKDFYDKTILYCKLIETKINFLNELISENILGIKDHIDPSVNQNFTYTGSNNAGQREGAAKF